MTGFHPLYISLLVSNCLVNVLEHSSPNMFRFVIVGANNFVLTFSYATNGFSEEIEESGFLCFRFV